MNGKNAETAKGPEAVAGKSCWNSLEITKLIISASVPIMICVVGLMISGSERRQAETRAKFDQVAKKRIELWDKIAVPLNGIYCYFLCVGNWKELHPTNVI